MTDTVLYPMARQGLPDGIALLASEAMQTVDWGSPAGDVSLSFTDCAHFLLDDFGRTVAPEFPVGAILRTRAEWEALRPLISALDQLLTT